MTTEGSTKIPASTGYYWVRFDLGIVQLAWLNAENRTVLVHGSGVVLEADRVKTWLAGPVTYKGAEEVGVPEDVRDRLGLPLPKPEPKSTAEVECCGSCRFFAQATQYQQQAGIADFWCRVGPPTFAPKWTSGHMAFRPTYPDQWCGKYQRKENTECSRKSESN